MGVREEMEVLLEEGLMSVPATENAWDSMAQCSEDVLCGSGGIKELIQWE